MSTWSEEIEKRVTDLEDAAVENDSDPIELNPADIFTAGAVQVLLATGIIRPSAKTVTVAGSGGAVTLTSNPSIYTGVNGQELRIMCNSATNTVTLVDGNGMQMAGNVTLGLYDTIDFFFDGISNNWIECARSNN